MNCNIVNYTALNYKALNYTAVNYTALNFTIWEYFVCTVHHLLNSPAPQTSLLQIKLCALYSTC